LCARSKRVSLRIPDSTAGRSAVHFKRRNAKNSCSLVEKKTTTSHHHSLRSRFLHSPAGPEPDHPG
jgi:hypothetical protein